MRAFTLRILQVAGVVLAFSVLWSLQVPLQVAAQAATVTTTATGNPGFVSVLGRGFDDDEVVSTWVTGPRGQVQFSGYYDADGDGDVAFQLMVPRHFEPGRWAITVHGLDSDTEGIGYFEVSPRGPDVPLTVSPASAPAGTTFSFNGSGFAADEKVSYWVTGPSDATYEGGVARANNLGVVTFTFLIGPGTQPGTWRMSAYGQSSDRLGVAAFTVE